ncbi:MAG: EcoRII N-terminal effector-binding domain-containing protein [Salinibacterium amurskyense]
MQLEHAETFIKTLSANDVGATGAHQAGILIPREPRILDFFPQLDPSKRNPRSSVVFCDTESGVEWDFRYIYYNGALTGDSTRNEYRLTGMTGYIRANGLTAGDGLELSKSVTGKRFITHLPADAGHNSGDNDPDIVVLSGTWKTRKARTL